MSIMPLQGIRVVDLTQAWAGAYTTCLLADMGAEVVKIEARKRADGWRGPLAGPSIAGASARFLGGKKPYDRSPLFHGINRNKLGITLDLDTAEGRELFIRLVKIGDVVAENFSARVMGNFGFDYSVLKEINPGIIMLSMPGYGTNGTYRNLKSSGGTIEPMSGISSLMGYPDGPPMNHGVMYPDPVAGMMGACAVLIALHHRKKTGMGQFIDLSQQETCILLLGEVLMDFALNKRTRGRKGNHHDFMAPHQYYRCRSKENWIAISISTDEEWLNLTRAMGEPDWAKDSRFATASGRLENEDELDRYLEGWTITRERSELMPLLQLDGIPAGEVLPLNEVMDNTHLKERGYIREVNYGEAGKYNTPGPAWQASATPSQLRWIAPDLGQDSEEVLTRLLGITHEEYEELVKKGVTGQEPMARY